MAAGDVRVSSDLHDVNVTGYDLYIYVYDEITLVGPKTLTVIFPCQYDKFDIGMRMHTKINPLVETYFSHI